MNLTLFSLSLINFSLTSPLFSPSFHSFSPFIAQSYSNLHITNSYKSFFYMKPFLSSSMHRQKTVLSFTNSHFMNFLHSTISISENSFQSSNSANILSSSDDDNNPRIFKREKIENTIYSNNDLVLKTINCFFIECTEPMSGGGIDMICEESSLIVIKCCFVNCYAQSQGGAISFFGNIFKVDDTCFDGCYTMDSAMAMEIYVKGSREKVYMTGLSITNCADKSSFNTKRENSANTPGRFHDGVGQFGVYLSNVIDMCRGKQRLTAINSTNNIVHLTGGFCLSEESTYFSLSFSTIVDNIADSLFTLYDLSGNAGNMSSCNVFNNTGSLSLTLFDLENSTMNVFGSVFLQNNISFVVSNGNLRFENCAYDFNSKNPPLENADFYETGTILHKLKSWRGLKTILFDQAQIDNNNKVYSRCSKNKPRYSQNDFQMRNNRFADHDFIDESILNRNNKNKDREEDEDNGKKNNFEKYGNLNDFMHKDMFNNNKDNNDDENNNKNDKNNYDLFNNKNNENNKNIDDNVKNHNDVFADNDIKNKENRNDEGINKKENNNKNNNNDDEDEEEDDNKNKNNNKNNKIEYDNFNKKINVADNEEEEEDNNNNNKQNENLINSNTKGHSRWGLVTFVFLFLIGGAIAFVYVFYIKDRERDLNQLQDIEML